MSKVVNEGLPKQVKLSTGRVVEIPQGVSTQPDDIKIKRAVDSNSKLRYATNKDLAPEKPKKKSTPAPTVKKEKKQSEETKKSKVKPDKADDK